MANGTRITKEIVERVNSEAESLCKTLIKAIPKNTHLVPLVYALVNMLDSLFETQCTRDERSSLIKLVVDIITMPESAQQQKEEEQDTPDENQEPQPQL